MPGWSVFSNLVEEIHIEKGVTMLDLDAFTGGFNLQIAWSTGHCAGVAAAQPDE